VQKVIHDSLLFCGEFEILLVVYEAIAPARFFGADVGFWFVDCLVSET
jgi:hypothetical protein